MIYLKKKGDEKVKLKCPECRAPLKQRKIRKPNECELICGGRGATFDTCDLKTVDRLQKEQ